jgi:hypothetical protein
MYSVFGKKLMKLPRNKGKNSQNTDQEKYTQMAKLIDGIKFLSLIENLSTAKTEE